MNRKLLDYFSTDAVQKSNRSNRKVLIYEIKPRAISISMNSATNILQMIKIRWTESTHDFDVVHMKCRGCTLTLDSIHMLIYL